MTNIHTCCQLAELPRGQPDTHSRMKVILCNSTAIGVVSSPPHPNTGRPQRPRQDHNHSSCQLAEPTRIRRTPQLSTHNRMKVILTFTIEAPVFSSFHHWPPVVRRRYTQVVRLDLAPTSTGYLFETMKRIKYAQLKFKVFGRSRIVKFYSPSLLWCAFHQGEIDADHDEQSRTR